MRILIVCKSLPFSFKGGIQTHVWELSKQLIENGHDVAILTAGTFLNGVQKFEKDGRQIIMLPYLPGRKIWGLRNTFEDLSFNVVAYLWLRKRGREYDRIHIQGRSGCIYASSNASKDAKVITTFHRLLNVEYEYDGQQTTKLDGFLHRLFLGFAEREAARNSDHVIAVSQEMKRELAEYVGENLAPLSIIPNGVNSAFGEHITEKKRWQLVFVGRLEKIKGIYTLIKAIEKVDKRIELILIGDGPERKNLEQLIKRKHLRLRVKFMGNQDSESVRFWIQRSYALVLPSFHETQGIVLLEAGICARPVISAQVPGIDEVIQHGHNGLMFPPGDHVCLSDTIQYLFKTPELATKLGNAGKRRALEFYDWKKIARQTEEVYRCLGISGAGERKVESRVIKDLLHSDHHVLPAFSKSDSLNPV